MDRTRAFVAFVILVGLGGTGLWIAVWGDAISGGIPFLPAAWNDRIGRVAFAGGGLICFGLAGLALRDALGRGGSSAPS
jgi:hypothetical protein